MDKKVVQNELDDGNHAKVVSKQLFDMASFRITLEVDSQLNLAEYKGFAIRGVLGDGLKALLCLVEMENCEGCPVYSAKWMS